MNRSAREISVSCLAGCVRIFTSMDASMIRKTLVEKVTGSKITPEPYVRYLTKKYSEIYGL